MSSRSLRGTVQRGLHYRFTESRWQAPSVTVVVAVTVAVAAGATERAHPRRPAAAKGGNGLSEPGRRRCQLVLPADRGPGAIPAAAPVAFMCGGLN